MNQQQVSLSTPGFQYMTLCADGIQQYILLIYIIQTSNYVQNTTLICKHVVLKQRKTTLD